MFPTFLLPFLSHHLYSQNMFRYTVNLFCLLWKDLTMLMVKQWLEIMLWYILEHWHILVHTQHWNAYWGTKEVSYILTGYLKYPRKSLVRKKSYLSLVHLILIVLIRLVAACIKWRTIMFKGFKLLNCKAVMGISLITL